MVKLPDILLISPPIIEGKSENADLLLNLVKEAAKDLYHVKLPQAQEPIIDSLEAASLLIAYLGDNSWNTDTLMEVGYRIGVNKPLFVLTNKNTDLLQEVPFDFPVCDPSSPKLVCQLPILTSWDKLNQIFIYKQTITELRNYLKQVRPKMQSAYAVAEILIDINSEHSNLERLSNSVFTMSSDKTDRLFHVEGSLVGVGMEEALKIIKPLIDPNQWQYFSDEQDQLLGKLTRGRSDILAKIPLIFKNSKDVSEELRGKAFLALITQYTFEKDSLLLKMLYYEVPNPLEKAPDGDYYICNLPSRPNP